MINKTKMMILAAMIGTSIVACKDDKKDDAATPNYSVVGTWNESLNITNEYVNGTLLSADTTTYAQGESTIELKADGMLISKTGSSYDTATYTYSGNTLTVVMLYAGAPVDTMAFTTSFSNANTLTVKGSSTEIISGTTFVTENVSHLQKIQ